MDWFLYDRDLHHEIVKLLFAISTACSTVLAQLTETVEKQLERSLGHQNQQIIPRYFSQGTSSKICQLLVQHQGKSTEAREVQGIRKRKIKDIKVIALRFFDPFFCLFQI